jgi:hypothetical protein
MMRDHRAFERYDRFRLAFSWEKQDLHPAILRMSIRQPLTVDQEVGGSSPPSCTSQASEIIYIIIFDRLSALASFMAGKHGGSTASGLGAPQRPKG